MSVTWREHVVCHCSLQAEVLTAYLSIYASYGREIAPNWHCCVGSNPLLRLGGRGGGGRGGGGGSRLLGSSAVSQCSLLNMISMVAQSE